MLSPSDVLDDRYTLERELGSGGQGSVWLAMDALLGAPRALKEDRTVGTRGYMAPEQLDPRTWGEHPDAPALDVFAWGVLAWQLLVG